MPANPIIPTGPYEATTIPVAPINLPEMQKDPNPVYGATVAGVPAGFNVPQSHVVTTPISLPGMPPITVSASLPQNTSFYPSVLQQNQLPSTTAPASATTTAPPTLISMPTSTQ